MLLSHVGVAMASDSYVTLDIHTNVKYEINEQVVFAEYPHLFRSVVH